jgi:hypothetical protein
MASLIVLTLLACGLSVLCCIANHLCHSGSPTVSLWFFRIGEDRES